MAPALRRAVAGADVHVVVVAILEPSDVAHDDVHRVPVVEGLWVEGLWVREVALEAPRYGWSEVGLRGFLRSTAMHSFRHSDWWAV